ncbi:STAS domain-containing protein [Actinomadura parmotrematis]|uniref:Anti-sigma factor antagonist n=1 Tax=Actinomadura parmotrematis TaxID=2864039 RepID=A0ABS7FUE3_9ACTN|nr:STAS domain-containing protein [Actinomadura parmotrematis]MBW8483143.1 STAS domain-containing protein [Actinomadura parmotrematis]
MPTPTAARSAAAPAASPTASTGPSATIVALRGDLDAAAAPALREHLRDALGRSTRLLILDLGEAGCCDSAGLAVLIGTQRRATGLGIALRLARPRPQMAELLRATGLGRSLTVLAG